jgi:hypothetical protein
LASRDRSGGTSDPQAARDRALFGPTSHPSELVGYARRGRACRGRRQALDRPIAVQVARGVWLSVRRLGGPLLAYRNEVTHCAVHTCELGVHLRQFEVVQLLPPRGCAAYRAPARPIAEGDVKQEGAVVG